MNSDWETFLKTQDAVFDGDHLTGFKSGVGAGEGEKPDWIALLPDWGILRIGGADACTFLQAHFTSDVSALKESGVQLSGYCSPKGRLLAVFYLVAADGGYYMVMPEEVIDSVQKRLEIFANMARPVTKQLIGNVARTDVELTNETSTLQVLGLNGSAAVEAALSHLGIDTQALNNQSSECVFDGAASKTLVFKVPNSEDRFLCIGTFENLSGLWSEVRKQAVPVADDRWRLADIRGGNPTIVSQIQDKFIPQMINLHLLGGVSFTKGCYPGQEIVARMQYLGKLKRLMLRYSFAGDAILPGTTLATTADAAAGTVLTSSSVGDGTSEALLVLKTSTVVSDVEGAQVTLESCLNAAEAGHRLNLAEGATLESCTLPYTLSDSPGSDSPGSDSPGSDSPGG